jgi:hypothetical protein
MNANFIPFTKALKVLFFFALFFMPMDGFYWGILVLREFGARPLNFILLLVGILFLLAPPSVSRLIRTEKKIIFLAGLILGLTICNIFVLLVNNPPSVLGRSPLIQWSLQYLTVFWFFISISIWVLWFDKLQISGTGYKWFLTTLITSTVLILAIFYYDFFIKILVGDLPEDILFFLKQKYESRPCGLSSEPSIFGSWALLVWPLLLFADKTRPWLRKLGKISHTIGYLCILSALISGARTFIIIFLLQIGVYLFTIVKKRMILMTLSALGLLAVGIFLWKISFPIEKVALMTPSFTEKSETDYSSMTRLASALAAVNIFLDHPISGVGLGQFTSYYAGYVPGWALPSEEVKGFINENISQRVNAFNLFARIGAEMGVALLIVFISFIYCILSPLYKKIRTYQHDRFFSKFYVGFFISCIGGISWWLTQDLFTYQPGIFALAMAIYLNASLKSYYYPLTKPLKQHWITSVVAPLSTGPVDS